MSNGKVIQIIGAVIDVEFEKDNIPNVYEALTIDGLEIILEVQHLRRDQFFHPQRKDKLNQ